MSLAVDPSRFAPLNREQLDGQKILRPSTTYWQDAWRRLRKHRLAMVSLVFISLLVLAAIFGPMMTNYTYDQTDLRNTYAPPSAEHPFGTDNLGRDVLTRVLYGARISLAVGLFTALISAGVGVVYGAVAAYAGGAVDNFMMRIVDVIYGLPFLLYVILLMVILGSGLQNVFIALGAVYWISMARIVRGEILSLKEREYVLAARTLGVSPWRIIIRHLVPNALGPIIITMTLMIPEAIFSEAFLSYIGLGVSAPVSSWGTLASEGQKAIRVAPWNLTYPSIFICATMLAFNFLGDGLRDALDPRMRK